MIIDHVGIVVRSLEQGIKRWEQLFGYKKHSEIVTNARQRVRVVFLKKDNSPTVKLIEPSDESSPIASIARKGGGLHHLCFRCDSLSAEIPRLEAAGARMIVPPQPGEAFKNNDIAFFFVDNLNFELIDTADKEGWLG
jgi:methylmalonyl-CoA/ethylmalonyl-CoA epimerase